MCKSILPVLVVALLLATPAVGRDKTPIDPDPGTSRLWSDVVVILSGSASDPYDNWSQPPFQGTRTIYLWHGCSFGPYGTARSVLDITGDLEVLSFTPSAGTTNSGTDTELDLAFDDCLVWEALIGSLVIRDSTGTGGALCFSGNAVSYACTTEDSLTTGYLGYSTSSERPCWTDDCSIDYVLPRSWGGIKSLYGE